MSIIPEDIREHLGKCLGPMILTTITSIRTLFVGQEKDEHSGTALMLTDDHGDTFCLTANHVVTPTSRTPPKTIEVVKHSYTENLRLSEDGDPTPGFMLRRKYYKSESCGY